MNITKISAEMATDLIELVNSLKGITYNAKVDYTLKNGGKKAFDYVTLDKIYSLVKANSNFALLEPLGTDEQGNSAVQIILIHKSGESITSDYYKIRVDEKSSKQDEGAAITYTKRYALGSFLGICTDEDYDANPEGKRPTEPKAPNKPNAFDDAKIKTIEEIIKGSKFTMAQVAKSCQKNFNKNSVSELTDQEFTQLTENISKAVDGK
jgi:hypothetical protein